MVRAGPACALSLAAAPSLVSVGAGALHETHSGKPLWRERLLPRDGASASSPGERGFCSWRSPLSLALHEDRNP
jgi:hypothetical protein